MITRQGHSAIRSKGTYETTFSSIGIRSSYPTEISELRTSAAFSFFQTSTPKPTYVIPGDHCKLVIKLLNPLSVVEDQTKGDKGIIHQAAKAIYDMFISHDTKSITAFNDKFLGQYSIEIESMTTRESPFTGDYSVRRENQIKFNGSLENGLCTELSVNVQTLFEEKTAEAYGLTV